MIHSISCVNPTLGYVKMPDGSMQWNILGYDVLTTQEAEAALVLRRMPGMDLDPENIAREISLFKEKLRKW